MPTSPAHGLEARRRHASIDEAIRSSLECREACLEALHYSLDAGADRADPPHLRLYMDCAEACGIAAEFLRRGSEFAVEAADLCIATCEATAEDCEAFPDDPVLEACAKACRVAVDALRDIST